MTSRFQRQPVKDYKDRVNRLIDLVHQNPGYGYTRLNRVLVQEYGKGLRKDTVLKIKRDVLGLAVKVSPIPVKLPKAAVTPPKQTIRSDKPRDIAVKSNWQWLASGTSKITDTGFRIFERRYGFALIDTALAEISTQDLRAFLAWLAKKFPNSLALVRVTVVKGSAQIDTISKAKQAYFKRRPSKTYKGAQDQKYKDISVFTLSLTQVEIYEDLVNRYYDLMIDLAMRPYPYFLVAIEVVNYV